MTKKRLKNEDFEQDRKHFHWKALSLVWIALL